MSSQASPATASDLPGADVLVAIDVGTSGARASAFDVAGPPVLQVRRSYPTFLPAEGWAEQDARRWQSAALSALGTLARSLGQRYRVCAVAVTGQCPSVVPLDHRDMPLRPGIIYRDNRATAAAAWMREKFGDDTLHRLTGHVPAAFHVAAKVLWLRAHEPDVFAATRRFVQPSDYVALALTGNATTDWSMAAATAVLDLRARRWATDLMEGLGLDTETFPAVVPSWSIAGEIRPALAHRLGLPKAVPVVAGAGDSIACALGAGVTQGGPVSEMAGSSSCFNSVTSEPLADHDVTHYPSIVADHGYVTEVGINTTGEALDWLAQILYTGSTRPPRRDDYARIENAAAAAEPGAAGLLFAPVLGDGERDDPALRGAITGLSLRHDRGALGARHDGGRRLRHPGAPDHPRPRFDAGHGTAGVRRAAQACRSGTRSRPTSPGSRSCGCRATRPRQGPQCSRALVPGSTATRPRRSRRGYRPAERAEPDPANRALYDDLYERYRRLVSWPAVHPEPRET